MGPVFLEAPVTKSTQIYTFRDAPLPENEPAIRAQLIEEVQIKAQRFLTAHLSRQKGFDVVPFDETRRLLADFIPPRVPMTDQQIRLLAAQTNADIVLTGLIHDYGAVRWQYWVTGWLLHVAVTSTAVGFASGWNPAILGAYVAFDATTDFPLWYGGAYVFGWAFRPVRVHVDAVQQMDCEGLIWTQEALVIKVPGKTLEAYPPEKRERKEIQLEANLDRAMEEIAETAGRKLRLQSCEADGTPPEIGGFSVLSILDHLY